MCVADGSSGCSSGRYEIDTGSSNSVCVEANEYYSTAYYANA